MLCPRCQAMLDGGSRFCTQCGASVGHVVRIGRDDSPGANDIVVNHFGQVSRTQAEVIVEPNQLLIRDLRSSNGTHVNGRRISPSPEVFQLTDEIRFGSYLFNSSQLVPAITQIRGGGYAPPPPMPGPGDGPPAGPFPGAGPGPQVPYGQSAAPFRGYAGFWIRFVAYLLDGLILGILSTLALVLVLIPAGAIGAMSGGLFGGLFAAAATYFMFVAPVLIILVWLYYALSESSAAGATLGKRAVGIRVTDLEGRRLTFGRATGRFFAKIISSLIPFAIGYIVAGLTEKKQAVHDLIAACLVVRN